MPLYTLAHSTHNPLPHSQILPQQIGEWTRESDKLPGDTRAADEPPTPRLFAGQGSQILVFHSVSTLSSLSPQVHKYQMWTVTEQMKSIRCVPQAVRVAVVSVVAAAACQST